MPTRSAHRRQHRQDSVGLIALFAATTATALMLAHLDGTDLVSLGSAWILVMAAFTAGYMVGWLVARIGDRYVASGCSPAWANRRSRHLKPFFRPLRPDNLYRAADGVVGLMWIPLARLRWSVSAKGPVRLRDPPREFGNSHVVTTVNHVRDLVNPVIAAIVVGLAAGICVAVLWALVCNVFVPVLSPFHGVLQTPLFVVAAAVAGIFVLFKG